MFSNLATYLRTPCPRHIRRIGYLHETIAMRERHRRRAAFWQSHLENTRKFILSAVERCKSRNTVVIFGSGLLLDVPLAQLSSVFREVVLTDIVCLPEVRREIGRYRNVIFSEYDVTSVAEQLYKNREFGIHELPDESRGRAHRYQDADLIVSLNILSQLTVIPRIYAIKELHGLSEDQLDEWCRRIVEIHYASLRSMPCNVCLISDYQFLKRDPAGGIFSKGSTVFDLPLPEPDASWTWNIEPIQKKSQFYSKELMVGAWHVNFHYQNEHKR